MPLEKDLRPGERWVFDEAVAAEFDGIFAKSIPAYASMRETLSSLAASQIRSNTIVMDLGCATGENIELMQNALWSRDAMKAEISGVSWIGVDSSGPMVLAARERFSGSQEPVTICQGNLASEWGWHFGSRKSVSVVTAVLTMCFVPLEYRQAVLRGIYESLDKHGALIIAEKLLGRDETLNHLLTREYHSVKRSNGYSQGEIDRKAAALEGVLVPVTADWLESMLFAAGFKQVECVWRCLNFGAWIAIKS